MPELPEVETIRKDLDQLIVGRKILDVSTDTPRKVLPSIEAMKKAVVGLTIKTVKRRAKLLQIFLSNGMILIIHLKMTGRLLVRRVDDKKDDWQHTVFTLTGSKQLRFCDSRKFGWIKLVKDERELKKILKGFGPEPLSDLDINKFKKILSVSSRPIKLVLTDQTKISGIGNIYANEALFLARINPKVRAKDFSPTQSRKLLKSIETVLTKGLRLRGASDQYYLDARGNRGSYQKHFLVYARQGKKCPGCQGVVKRINLGGRGTFFCPSCQS